MNRILVAVTVAMFSLISVNSYASDKTPEEKCKAEAQEKKVAADKMDAFVKECIEKHSKDHKADGAKK